MACFEIQDGDDWVVVKKDNEVVYRGHGPYLRDWAVILQNLGNTVELRCGEFGEDNDGNDTLFHPYR